jgi:hypothetical protein
MPPLLAFSRWIGRCTVRNVAQQLADAEEIFVSEDVYSAAGVHALLNSREVVSSVFKLKGVQ